MARKIFADVRKNGAKVVLKNDQPVCVLLSPDNYVKLMDEVDEARLLALASDRIAQYDPASVLTEADVRTELELSAESLDAVNDPVLG